MCIRDRWYQRRVHGELILKLKEPSMATGQKGNFNPESVQTRAERLKHIEIPESTDDIIIVQPNLEALGFRYNCYNPILQGYGISRDDFDHTVRECTRICEFVWRKKKLEENAEYMPILRYILILAFIFVLGSFGLLSQIAASENEDGTIITLALICIALATTLSIFVIVKAMLSRPEFINLEPEIFAKLSSYLNSQNDTIYRSKGLHWQVQDTFYWLELHINKPPRSHGN
eukprot:TRINITY_DN3728_c0_g1_i1.p1 TRINITY_DN3728_c0_g1~~TRINITY_DN3728_c0_g1_i1.p1  ORF type:complete len:231 (-),score=57.82 TRINITY_DN3728_c0_g1_i1:163-855(-)